MTFHFPSNLAHFLVFIKIYFQSHTKMCIILFHWKQSMNDSSSGMTIAISLICFQCSLLHRAKPQFRFRWQEYFRTWWLPVLFIHELYFLNGVVNVRALLWRYSSLVSFIKLHKSWLKREWMFGNVPYVN